MVATQRMDDTIRWKKIGSRRQVRVTVVMENSAELVEVVAKETVEMESFLVAIRCILSSLSMTFYDMASMLEYNIPNVA